MDWLTILGVVLIIEGVVPLLFPKQWHDYLHKLSLEPISTIRFIGGFVFTVGALLLVFR